VLALTLLISVTELQFAADNADCADEPMEPVPMPLDEPDVELPDEEPEDEPVLPLDEPG
jgi:hypothetical protein